MATSHPGAEAVRYLHYSDSSDYTGTPVSLRVIAVSLNGVFFLAASCRCLFFPHFLSQWSHEQWLFLHDILRSLPCSIKCLEMTNAINGCRMKGIHINCRLWKMVAEAWRCSDVFLGSFGTSWLRCFGGRRPLLRSFPVVSSLHLQIMSLPEDVWHHRVLEIAA